MSAQISQVELNLTIIKVLEMAYRHNEGVTARLVRQQGRLKLLVDHNGNATISGDKGGLAFSASEALQQIGAAVKGVTVLIAVNDKGELKFSGSVRLGAFGQATVKGTVDVEKFLTTCSGILCRATRLLRNRPAQIDRQLNEALGY